MPAGSEGNLSVEPAESGRKFKISGSNGRAWYAWREPVVREAMKNYTAALVCCVLAGACQYFQQEETAPEKGAPWSTAYGGNGPLPGSIPQCSNDFECSTGQICFNRRCVAAGVGGESGFDAGTVVDCVDTGETRAGVLRPYALPSDATKAGCGHEVESVELATLIHVATGFGQYYGALNSEDFGAAAACGACIEISREGFTPLGATIVDECEADCAAGDVSLSAAALRDLGVAAGELPSISWRYAECPTFEVVSFRIEDPLAAQGAVQVQGHRFAISGLEANVAGIWQAAMRREDNYWLLPLGALSNSVYAVRVTDINGSVLETSLVLIPDEQFSGQQFPSCM